MTFIPGCEAMNTTMWFLSLYGEKAPKCLAKLKWDPKNYVFLFQN